MCLCQAAVQFTADVLVVGGLDFKIRWPLVSQERWSSSSYKWEECTYNRKNWHIKLWTDQTVRKLKLADLNLAEGLKHCVR